MQRILNPISDSVYGATEPPVLSILTSIPYIRSGEKKNQTLNLGAPGTGSFPREEKLVSG